jgi:hypothetical protein
MTARAESGAQVSAGEGAADAGEDQDHQDDRSECKGRAAKKQDVTLDERDLHEQERYPEKAEVGQDAEPEAGVDRGHRRSPQQERRGCATLS